MKKEHIPASSSQSFRFFAWDSNLGSITQYEGKKLSNTLPGMGNSWHYHPEIELTFFTRGEGLRYVGDNISSFKAPEMVLLGSNLPHYWTVEQSSGYCIQFSFDATSPLASLHESGYFKQLIDQANKGLLFSQQCSRNVLNMLEQCVSCAPVERLALFLNIIHHLSQSCPCSISAYVPQGISKSKSAVVKKAVQYIVEHATQEELQLQDVLKHVGMSRASFSRHFQTAVGQSYTQFVQSIRLETARNLLLTTDKPVTEIAYASGFSNLSHFNRLFKKRWAMSPRSLRSLPLHS